jgi:hypothetical protein
MSARTSLRNAIKLCVLEITGTGAYNYNYRQVYDPPTNMEQMFEYPSVNILYGTERRLGNTHKIGNNPLYDLILPVQFDIFLHDINNTTLAQDKALADLQRYFGFNYYVRPTGGAMTAFEAVYLSATPWGTEIEIPNCGISIDFELYYSIRVNDPDVMV